MFPVTDCNQKVDQYIIDELNRLYKDESLPDLAIENVDAKRSGRYINFDAVISNFGLSDAAKVNITIYADSERIDSIELSKIGVGMNENLSVKNIRGPKSFDKLIFVLDTEEGHDLDVSNNRAEISLIS